MGKQDEDANEVAEKLRSMGYEVENLEARPEQEVRTADLRAVGPDAEVLIVEVKSRDPRGPDFVTEDGERITDVPIGRERKVENVVRAGRDQVNATRSGDHELGGVWVRGGPGAAGQAELEAGVLKLAGVRDLHIDGQAVPVVGVEATGFEDLDFAVFEFEGGGIAVILSPWAPHLKEVRRSRLVERAHSVVDYRALIEEGDVWEAPSRAEAARLAAKYRDAARERGGSPKEPSNVGDARKRRELEVVMAFMHQHPDRTFGGFWAWRHYEVGVEVPIDGEG